MVFFRLLNKLRSPPHDDDNRHLFSIAAMDAPDSAKKSCVLQTARGSLKGIEVTDKKTDRPLYRRYARIRYALPPVGDRRWRKPEPLPPDWIFSNGNNRPRDYRKFGAMCHQVDSASALLNCAGDPEMTTDMSEDCLFLNVWVPAGAEEPVGGWPVQFTIYEFRKRTSS